MMRRSAVGILIGFGATLAAWCGLVFASLHWRRQALIRTLKPPADTHFQTN
jgi:cell division protein FtsX